MKKRIYWSIDIMVLAISTVLFFMTVADWPFDRILGSSQSIIPLLGVILCTNFVYLLKGIRLYLILLEKRIDLKLFLKTYAKTMFVIVVLPWKLGEFFRIFCYGETMKDYRSGFLSILVDRFFDTLPILCIILFTRTETFPHIFSLTWILLFFLICTTTAYLVFPSAHQYFNRFLIIKTTSVRSLFALAILEDINKWYEYTRRLVEGREILLLFLSSAAYLFEYIALSCIAILLKLPFGISDFALYLEHVFFGTENQLKMFYVMEGSLLLLFVIALIYVIELIKKRRKDENKK